VLGRSGREGGFIVEAPSEAEDGNEEVMAVESGESAGRVSHVNKFVVSLRPYLLSLHAPKVSAARARTCYLIIS